MEPLLDAARAVGTSVVMIGPAQPAPEQAKPMPSGEPQKPLLNGLLTAVGLVAGLLVVRRVVATAQASALPGVAPSERWPVGFPVQHVDVGLLRRDRRTIQNAVYVAGRLPRRSDGLRCRDPPMISRIVAMAGQGIVTTETGVRCTLSACR